MPATTSAKSPYRSTFFTGSLSTNLWTVPHRGHSLLDPLVQAPEVADRVCDRVPSVLRYQRRPRCVGRHPPFGMKLGMLS